MFVFFEGNGEGIEALAKPIFVRGASPFNGSGTAAPFNGSGTAVTFNGSGTAVTFNGCDPSVGGPRQWSQCAYSCRTKLYCWRFVFCWNFEKDRSIG